MNLFDWMSQWRRPKHDDLMVRSILGRLLFTGDDYKKKVNICSGGEKNRLLFGKLMMEDHNILLMDEPTNHMDIEAIEALNMALLHYEGTIIFVSHDREFVSSLATQILDIKQEKLNYYPGPYEEYLDNQLANQNKSAKGQ
jgi:ATPase subunit of ABC transporter with duplicated ATPase domains